MAAKTVTVTMKGWKWSDGEAVDARSLIFFLNMTEAEKANWYAYSNGLLPDNIASYKATSPDTVAFQLNRAYSSLWFTYNQLAELSPMPLASGCHQARGQAGQRWLRHRHRGRPLGQVQGGLRVPDRPVQAGGQLRLQPAVVGGGRAVEAVQLQHQRPRHDGAEQESTQAR